MKKSKKALALGLVSTLGLSTLLTACGGGGQATTESKEAKASEAAT